MTARYRSRLSKGSQAPFAGRQRQTEEPSPCLPGEKEGPSDAFDGRATLAGTFDTVATLEPSESGDRGGSNGENAETHQTDTPSTNSIPQTPPDVKPDGDGAVGVGAAQRGFAGAYDRLQGQTPASGFHQDGENAYRQQNVPMRDFDGRAEVAAILQRFVEKS